nr:cytochrome P450 93A3 [Tanacetum cinerariifolium]
MVRSKSVSTKKQSQQVNPDDEEEDDLNIADDVTQDKQQSIAVMEKPQKKRGINKVKILPVGESIKFNKNGAAIEVSNACIYSNLNSHMTFTNFTCSVEDAYDKNVSTGGARLKVTMRETLFGRLPLKVMRKLTFDDQEE